jgi:WhiB family redox-sensing transcriptional regulator
MAGFKFINVPCQETNDVNVFFPDPTDTEGILKAKSYCDRCLKSAECLTFAMETQTNYGVFGGLTEEERRRVKRRNQRLGLA